MNQSTQNFSGYTQFSQNTIYCPTPIRSGIANIPASTSPDFCTSPQGFSPMNSVTQMQYGYDRNQSQSPVINLMECQAPIEEVAVSGKPSVSGTMSPTLKMRHKLNSRSKAFVKRDLREKNDRKASSDTKAQTEDEGNSSDDSESSFMAAAPTLVLKKCMTTQNRVSPTDNPLAMTEKAQTSFVTKFKTELCKNWQAGGCKFGSKCAFAHGLHELSEKKNLPSNYKTKICKQFHEEMYCSYGSRCQFIHLETQEKDQQDSLTKAINSLAGLSLGSKSTSGRLDVFKNLTK